MKFFIDFWKAKEEYRKHVEKIVTATIFDDDLQEKEREKLLTLERFAIWLNEEWPAFSGYKQ